MLEKIYTIPVNEAFDLCKDDPAQGCPFCHLRRRLENDEIEIILGASMMEPDVRIKTNEQGFCRLHYDLMFTRKNRLGMALTLESHLDDLTKEIKDTGLGGGMGNKPIKRIGALESTCYTCKRIEFNFRHMVETVVILWNDDPDFDAKLKAQPYICLPHYRMILECGQKRLSKKKQQEFAKICSGVVETYMAELKDDVSWF